MISRDLSQEFLHQLKEYPVVTLLGPRQAGKTTMARELLKEFSYVSLETPDILTFAQEDPIGFLAQYPKQSIFDEIQRAPHLINYLQGIVDESGRTGCRGVPPPRRRARGRRFHPAGAGARGVL